MIRSIGVLILLPSVYFMMAISKAIFLSMSRGDRLIELIEYQTVLYCRSHKYHLYTINTISTYRKGFSNS